VWDLGGQIGITTFAAMEDALAGIPPRDPALVNPEFHKTEPEFNSDLYRTTYASYIGRKSVRKDVKPGTVKPTDLFGHF